MGMANLSPIEVQPAMSGDEESPMSEATSPRTPLRMTTIARRPLADRNEVDFSTREKKVTAKNVDFFYGAASCPAWDQAWTCPRTA